MTHVWGLGWRLWAVLGVLVMVGQTTSAAELELDKIVRKSSIWNLSPDDFAGKYGNYQFRWNAADKSSARSVAEGLEFQGLRVIEAIAYFKDGKDCSGFTFLMYSRGDSGEMSEQQFERQTEEAMETINKFMRSRPKNLENFGTSGADKEAYLWTTAHLALQLEWSMSREDGKNRPEYLRLRVFEADDGQVSLVKKSPRKLYTRELLENIKTEEGTVYLANVPMVDQGEKGYCAVAVCERILRYYGRQVDQHELAEIAKTEDGTSLTALVDGLKSSSRKLGVKTEVMEEFDVDEYLDLVEDYNRAAKKMDKRELPDKRMIRYTNPMEVFAAMDPEVLREGKLRSKSHFEGFKKDVKRYVDQGIPVIWGVFLGVIPEKGYQGTIGFHLRMIIGYSEDGKEIVYTDTWGRGHELKRMATEDAWAITTSLLVMKPN